MIRAVLIGCVHSSKVALETLTRLSGHVVLTGVMTRRSSTYNSDFEDLSGLAKSANCPLLFVEDCPDDASQAAWVRGRCPDIVFCIGWSRLLGPELLRSAPYGVIGYHPAALPANRGRHPLVWAIALGLQQTASTFFVMDEGTDSGPLVSQIPIEISFEDDARTLYSKITQSIPSQIEQIVASLSNGSFCPVTQDHSQASYWRKRSEEDGRIDWRMSATSVYNLVRALTKPYPGAYAVVDGRPTKIWKCRPLGSAAKNIEPGRVVSVGHDTFTVKCGEGAIEVLAHEFPSLPAAGTYL